MKCLLSVMKNVKISVQLDILPFSWDCWLAEFWSWTESYMMHTYFFVVEKNGHHHTYTHRIATSIKNAMYNDQQSLSECTVISFALLYNISTRKVTTFLKWDSQSFLTLSFYIWQLILPELLLLQGLMAIQCQEFSCVNLSWN